MAFIRVQKLKTDDDGGIISGSASVIDTQYVKDAGTKAHSRQSVRESLGRVVWLSEDKKSGIFISPVRGLVYYDVAADSFSDVDAADGRLKGCPRIPTPPAHAAFGDVYLLLAFMKNSGILSVLRKMCPEDREYERLLAHFVHSFLKDGSHIKCDTFIEQSAISFVLTHLAYPTLRSDTPYFEWMADDSVKVRFFQGFIELMRKQIPDFGKACYVDSTPLPDDIKDNPYNALRCQAGKGCSTQMRLALVLDEKTGLPVWYQLFPGTRMDMSTLEFIREDVASTLGIEICSFVLDSGYTSENLIRSFKTDPTIRIITLMPDRKGYPYHELYEEFKDSMLLPKFDIMYDGAPYSGWTREIVLFDTDVWTYVFVDKQRALDGYRHYRIAHEQEFQKLTDDEQLWKTVETGFFILISNKDTTTGDILERYRERTDIEEVFKTAKSFLGLLPLAKWNDRTVRGKILHDVIETIVRLLMRSRAREIREERKKKRRKRLPAVALMDSFHECAANICFRTEQGGLRIDTPTRQVREAYDRLGYSVPAYVKLEQWKKELLL